MIEHVEEPLAMLELMRSAIAAAPEPRLFLETPDVEWILENRVVWDFFYEHCSYFTPRSIEYAARLAGLEIDRVDLVFGGQYMWAQGRPAEGRDAPPPTASLRAATEEFERAERQLWERLAAQIDELSGRGAVAVWGAGAKGVTFVNRLDPDAEALAGVVDLNPILAPHDLDARGVVTAVLLNPNYEQEIREMLAAAGSSVDLVGAEQVGAVN